MRGTGRCPGAQALPTNNGRFGIRSEYRGVTDAGQGENVFHRTGYGTASPPNMQAVVALSREALLDIEAHDIKTDWHGGGNLGDSGLFSSLR